MSDKNLWWKPAFEIFGKVSMWVVAPILLALIAGKWLDAQYGTRPWIFLCLTGVGFLISLFGIVRTIGTYMRQIEKEGNLSRLIGDSPKRREKNGEPKQTESKS